MKGAVRQPQSHDPNANLRSVAHMTLRAASSQEDTGFAGGHWAVWAKERIGSSCAGGTTYWGWGPKKTHF